MLQNKNQKIIQTHNTIFIFAIHEPQTHGREQEAELIRALAQIGVLSHLDCAPD